MTRKALISGILLLVGVSASAQVDTTWVRKNNVRALNSNLHPEAATSAGALCSKLLKNNTLSKSTQWLRCSWTATEVHWFVRQPGIYAANGVSYTVASDSDVVIDWEGFDSLKSENGGLPIPIWYAIWGLGTPPSIGDPAWISSNELNSENDTILDSPYLPGGITWRRWNRIEISQTHQSCECVDSAAASYLTYGDCCTIFPLGVRASVAQWISSDPSSFIADSSYEAEVFRWDESSHVWVSQGIGNPFALARAYMSLPKQYECPLEYLTGDANGDGIIDLGDVVYLLNYLFKGGASPVPLEAGDANCDGIIDIGDVVYLLNYLFKGGPAPGC